MNLKMNQGVIHGWRGKGGRKMSKVGVLIAVLFLAYLIPEFVQMVKDKREYKKRVNVMMKKKVKL